LRGYAGEGWCRGEVATAFCDHRGCRIQKTNTGRWALEKQTRGVVGVVSPHTCSCRCAGRAAVPAAPPM
jgi:hypothetical protein